ncbi:family 43 glycosylhydrolase [Paenibacillus sp. CAU 1782]
MKKLMSLIAVAALLMSMLSSVAYADNPVVQTMYTADPAPLVYNDTFYLYTGHDEDNASFFTMKEWRVYSTTDMANWTDHGSPLDLTAFSWAKSDAWAAQVIQRNGKFYYYVTVSQQSGGYAVGVAVSDSPTGPFKDVLGKPLVANNGARAIDPTVFIDDDGQAYLYWGNGSLWYVKLNEDMISYSGNIEQVDLSSGFGPEGRSAYTEAAWLYKRGSLYYMLYAAGGIPEHIAYSTSASPTGPWTYRGVIMPTQGSSFTNHPGVAEYKGNSYFVYHNGALPGGGGYARSVAIEKFNYNADGTIPSIDMTTTGAPQIATLNPYVRQEAETIAWASGVKTEVCDRCDEGGLNVHAIDNGDYIKVEGVDFGSNGAGIFTAGVASGSSGGEIELRLDGVNGPLIGTLPVSNTGGDHYWREKTTNVAGATGVHDVYMVFKGNSAGNLFKLDYWQFGERSSQRELVAIHATLDKHKIDRVAGHNTAVIKVTGVYSDGSSQDLSSQSKATMAQNGIVSVAHGVVTGKRYGSTSIFVNYYNWVDVLFIEVKDLHAEQAVKSLSVDRGPITLNTGRTASFKLTAEYLDGRREDVTHKATYTNLYPEVATVTGGTVTAKSGGTTTVGFSFGGERGEAATAQLVITVNEPPVSNPFMERNGVVAIEAEEAADNTAHAYVNDDNASGHTWSLVEGQATKAMQFLPDNGFQMTATDPASLAATPKLGYVINFANAGRYQVWGLIEANGANADSIHVGLDNTYKFTQTSIVNNNTWRWNSLGTLDITAGLHELSLWGREDGTVVDRLYLTTSALTGDPVWPPDEPETPAAVLAADSVVKPGSSFTVEMSLNSVTESIYAQDLTLTYDSSIFEYASAEGVTDSTQIVTEDKSRDGEVRLITAYIGGVSGENTPVLKLSFKVKAGVQSKSGTIAATRIQLGTALEGKVILATPASKTIAVSDGEQPVDKHALNKVIAYAQELYNAAVSGEQPGQYPRAAKDLLGEAIASAKAVNNDAGATQLQVNAAVDALSGAIATFRASVIVETSADINRDGSIDVGDLAIVAYHYGKNSASADWQAASAADMNNDSQIDIADLSYVALKLLG